MPTWRQNDFDEAFSELILWSQVQVLVGPPIVRKPLIFEVSGFFSFRHGLHQTYFVKNSSRVIFLILHGLRDKNLNLQNRN